MIGCENQIGEQDVTEPPFRMDQRKPRNGTPRVSAQRVPEQEPLASSEASDSKKKDPKPDGLWTSVLLWYLLLENAGCLLIDTFISQDNHGSGEAHAIKPPTKSAAARSMEAGDRPSAPAGCLASNFWGTPRLVGRGIGDTVVDVLRLLFRFRYPNLPETAASAGSSRGPAPRAPAVGDDPASLPHRRTPGARRELRKTPPW